jgi:hypothetical protein
MRVRREDIGTVANTVASNYCLPCVLAYIATKIAGVLCEG